MYGLSEGRTFGTNFECHFLRFRAFYLNIFYRRSFSNKFVPFLHRESREVLSDRGSCGFLLLVGSCCLSWKKAKVSMCLNLLQLGCCLHIRESGCKGSPVLEEVFTFVTFLVEGSWVPY